MALFEDDTYFKRSCDSPFSNDSDTDYPDNYNQDNYDNAYDDNYAAYKRKRRSLQDGYGTDEDYTRYKSDFGGYDDDYDLNDELNVDTDDGTYYNDRIDYDLYTFDGSEMDIDTSDYDPPQRRKRRSDYDSYDGYDGGYDDSGVEAECTDIKDIRYNKAIDDGLKLFLDKSRTKRFYFLSDQIFDNTMFSDVAVAYSQMLSQMSSAFDTSPIVQILMSVKDTDLLRSDEINVNTIDVADGFATELENQLCQVEKPVSPIAGVEETGSCLSPVDVSIIIDAGVPSTHRYKLEQARV